MDSIRGGRGGGVCFKTSHSFLGTPCTTDQVGGPPQIDTVHLLFGNGLRLLKSDLFHCVPNHGARRNAGRNAKDVKKKKSKKKRKKSVL